jgi:Protein of unknown function (DUF3500)
MRGLTRTLVFVSAVAAAVAALSASSLMVGQRPSASPTQAVVVAADAFLKTLGAELRGKVQFPFTPQKSATMATFARSGGPPGGPGGRGDAGGRGDTGRQGEPGRQGNPGGRGGPGGGFAGFVGEKYGDAVWSNFPVSDVPRPGIKIGDLSPEQRSALMHVLQVLLSPNGYQKVLDIMGSDQALADGGTNFSAGTAFYTVGIFGTPSATTPWMLQFGGHHLGLNVVFVETNGVMTPTLTGAQPAVYTANGKTVRVLAQENDKAFALMDALDAGQRTQAILNFRVGDLVLGPGQDGKTIAAEGLKASAMTEPQRSLLLELIAQWSGIVNDGFAAPRLADIKAGLPDTYFAWSGPTTHEPNRNGTSYYRIQGPKLFIEFSPQGVGGDPSNHVHTMYRDPTNDYGRALLSK